MDRLSKFAASGEHDILSYSKDLDIFKLFKKYTDKIIEEQRDKLETTKMLELEVAFLKFSIKTYPNNIDYVNPTPYRLIELPTGYGTIKGSPWHCFYKITYQRPSV